MLTETQAQAMADEIIAEINQKAIEKMAKAAGVAPFQMRSMINRCDELKEFFIDYQRKVIIDLASISSTPKTTTKGAA